jgi:hypothetical protein
MNKGWSPSASFFFIVVLFCLGAPVLSAACSVRINVRKILQDKVVSHPTKIYTKRASILLHKEVHTVVYIKMLTDNVQLFKV